MKRLGRIWRYIRNIPFAMALSLFFFAIGGVFFVMGGMSYVRLTRLNRESRLWHAEREARRDAPAPKVFREHVVRPDGKRWEVVQPDGKPYGTFVRRHTANLVAVALTTDAPPDIRAVLKHLGDIPPEELHQSLYDYKGNIGPQYITPGWRGDYERAKCTIRWKEEDDHYWARRDKEQSPGEVLSWGWFRAPKGFLAALRQVELVGNDRDGDERPCGPYRLSPSYWAQGCEQFGLKGPEWAYDTGVFDAEQCEAVMCGYWARHGAKSDKMRALIQNGGPGKNWDPNALIYWQRVQMAMKTWAKQVHAASLKGNP